MIVPRLRTFRNVIPSIVFACLIVLLTCEKASAASGLALNFYWWTSASEIAREGAVQGAIDGIRAAWTTGYYDSREDVGAVVYKEFKLGKFAKKDMWSVTSAMGFENIRKSPRFSKPVGAYVKAISSYYATYKSARDKSIVFPLEFCLEDNPIESCAKTSTHPLRL